ncbi:MAG: PEP/pyruvate-binding domain-containing protein, partial [Pseudomonadota bacterium]
MGLLDFIRKRQPERRSPDRLKRTFVLFQTLLRVNNDALNQMADLEEKLSEDYLFDMQFIRSRLAVLEAAVDTIITSLAKMSGNRWPELAVIRKTVAAELAVEVARRACPPRGPEVLPLSELQGDNLAAAGGKAAGLAAVISAGLPVPDGFVVTLPAYHAFMEHHGLGRHIEARLSHLTTRSARDYQNAAAEIRGLILTAPLPPGLEEAMRAAYGRLAPGGEPVAVRSSASREDSSAFSFAGQYSSFLGVEADDLAHYYKEVIASRFGVPALFYLRNQGLIDPAEIGMAVLVQRMLSPLASGVMFTLDPEHCDSERMVIQATLGLAAELVSGVAAADTFWLDRRTGAHLGERLSLKPHRLTAERGNLLRAEVSEATARTASVPPQVLDTLRDQGLMIEQWHGAPQDVEWAWDGETVYIVQSRHLRLADPVARCSVELARALAKAEVLIQGATPGSPGAASGRVFSLAPSGELDLDLVPPGSVLVVPHTSPRLGPLLPRLAAVVAEVGAATGHLALLAREYRVPLLVDAAGASALLPQGEMVTVDAHGGRVYRGKVEEVIQCLPRRDPLLSTAPVHARLKAVLERVAPLNLVDARQPGFKAAACRTYHDITRFAHEKAVEAMFGLIDDLDLRHDAAARVDTRLPINLYVIDLGGGLREGAGIKAVRPQDFVSVPMLALWKGMTYPGVSWAGPVPVDVSGFLHVIAQSAIRP